MSLVIRNARVLTLARGAAPRRGAALADPGVIDRGFVRIDGGRIVEVGPEPSARPGSGSAEGPPPCPLPEREDSERAPGPGASAGGKGSEIDARGRVVMPAFVDAHTHALWAGDRLDEIDMKRRGASYLDILRAGGGIMATVRAVRAASEDKLVDNLSARLTVMAREGTGTVEVKSGYGLTTEDELKMLRAIRRAGEASSVRVRATALLGHALDPEQGDFVKRTVDETLPAVHAEFPDVAVDAYCEQSAWSLEDCRRLFDAARGLGHPLRVHADQFHALGMTELAIEMGFLSVDHLEATRGDTLDRLAASQTLGVMLPCGGFQVDGRYADGRRFVDCGGALVIATNCNPGSAPTSSAPFAIALASRHLGLSAQEAIAACTANGAALLGLEEDTGSLEAGKRADVIMLRHTDERMLGYEFGGDPVDLSVMGGAVVKDARRERGRADTIDA